MNHPNFIIEHTGEDGTAITLPLDGEEIYITTCPECGDAVRISSDDFFILMADPHFELHGSRIYCESCSENHQAVITYVPV